MIIDAQTQLAASVALTSTALLTNAYDCGAIPTGGTANGAAVDISIGEPMCVIVAVVVAADSTTGDETYEFDVIQSASNTLSSADILAKYPIAAANVLALLPAGAILCLPIPPHSVTKQWLGVNYIGGGTTPTITVSAWIAPISMLQAYRYYTTLINVA